VRARQRGEPPAEVVLTAANSETVAQQVRDGAADLGFVEGPTSPQGLCGRVIGHDGLVVVVRPDHPWAKRRQPLSPGELAATRLVSREEASGTRDALAAALTAVLTPARGEKSASRAVPPATLALATTAAVGAAVLAGAGARHAE
jgi:DNA-binding transcriptional LysR family regulator